MQGCQHARYILTSLCSVSFKTSLSTSAAISLPTNHHDAEMTFCLRDAFWIIAPSAIATSVISGLCVRHYRIANWWDNESTEFEGFGKNLVISILRFGLLKTCHLYMLAHVCSSTVPHARSSVLVCVYPIWNVLQILCDSAELFLHTNIETWSKTSLLSSLFADSFTISLTQQLDKTQ